MRDKRLDGMDHDPYYDDNDYYYDYYDHYDTYYDLIFHENSYKLPVPTFKIESENKFAIDSLLSKLRRDRANHNMFEKILVGSFIFSIETDYIVGNFMYSKIYNHSSFSVHVMHVTGEYVVFEDDIRFKHKTWAGKFNGDVASNINYNELLDILAYCFKVDRYLSML